jgi:hypothetical protein
MGSRVAANPQNALRAGYLIRTIVISTPITIPTQLFSNRRRE